MPNHPLLEVFGYPTAASSEEAAEHRNHRLCPFGNRVPKCTKNRVADPLGVCSIKHKDGNAIICPIRFRQDEIVMADAADFFFAPDTRWLTLYEVRLRTKQNAPAGNIDIVLVAFDERGQVMDFGALEIQSVYISGNISEAFAWFMENPEVRNTEIWSGKSPRPDYLSSSRKRLVPQLSYKGHILHQWGKKQAVAIHSRFFDTLPDFDEVSKDEADLAWLVYELEEPKNPNERLRLTKIRSVYTMWSQAIQKVQIPDAGDLEVFESHLQSMIDPILIPEYKSSL